MIPSTLLGLLLFAGSIAPGYIYILIAERRRPRPPRSGALEVAELVSVGGLCSALGLLAGLAVAKHWDWVDVDVAALARDGTDYLITESFE